MKSFKIQCTIGEAKALLDWLRSQHGMTATASGQGFDVRDGSFYGYVTYAGDGINVEVIKHPFFVPVSHIEASIQSALDEMRKAEEAAKEAAAAPAPAASAPVNPLA